MFSRLKNSKYTLGLGNVLKLTIVAETDFELAEWDEHKKDTFESIKFNELEPQVAIKVEDKPKITQQDAETEEEEVSSPNSGANYGQKTSEKTARKNNRNRR